MKNMNFLQSIMIPNIVASVLSFADIIVFTRKNLEWGIPDKFFVLGGTVTSAIISNWMWMPGVMIMSRLCPAGMEATMFALLAGEG
jgi:hypothetical protein